ncbi:SDH family Clp fold serine proteinase [Leptospira stimsonii]|uniref:Serine protease n=1 Tax=Leptospira stimsonii TaxID=2202203 RepID=A0ABY2MZ93_9LEPT|nr:ATP-dependent Clp protease proteolytic subunit [Leptospira stimsonii]TGK15745.1 hypothetical protein EHO98_14400 [Leptospira stimsonii]TGM12549.1 hypothetical protein EHQ90_15320 [Leptospira stimsonii]
MTSENTEESKRDQATEEKAEIVKYDLSIQGDIYKMFTDKLSNKEIENYTKSYLNSLISKHKMTNYILLFLYDEFTSISRFEADQIYKELSKHKSKGKDVFLIIHSNGGEIEPAFLISQTCKKKSKEKFIVGIPRTAKSAATLISLGADEIHMGLMSELGPIDPQINNLPALALGNALEYIAKLVKKHPESSQMFASYLSSKLQLNMLGYFERVSESAAQYAERLIGDKKLPTGITKETVAHRLVYHYKDHNFLIDIDEAKSFLGTDFVKTDTPELLFCNEVYSLLNELSLYYRYFRKKQLSLVGTINDGVQIRNDSSE